MSQHTCPAIVIGCIDFRLCQALQKWAKEEYGSFDAVNLAGGGRNLIEPDTKELILTQIDISKRLHSCGTVVIVNHWDCGFYGGSQSFGHDATKERDKYQTDLAEAAIVVSKRFPTLKVRTFLQLLDGKMEEIPLLALELA